MPVAEILSNICQCFYTPAVKEAWDQCIGSCLCLEKNWASLQQERVALKATSEDLERKVTLEEQSTLNEPSNEVRQWRQRFASLTNNETQQQAEYDTLERCLCNCTPNIWRRFWLGQKVSSELQEVRNLKNEENTFATFCLQRLPSTVEETRTRKITFGMEEPLNLLHEYFSDEGRSVIGIHGLAGVGKTTLLFEFNHELKERYDYQVVIYIEVSNSEVLNVADMQETIAHRLGLLPWDNGEREAFRAKRIFQALINKKFVILLDDVREKFELDKIGIPDPSGVDIQIQSKLIIASQSMDVCKNMEAHQNMIEVKCLETKDAWDLFEQNLSEEAKTAIEGDRVIKEKANAIVRTCGGLPLAIKVIGRAVASLKGQREWTTAADTLMEEPEHLTGMKADLFSRLKYSYDQLNSDVNRSCFLYCALFPEYGSFKKKQLIGYWICEGLVSRERNNIIDELVSASLLEKSGDFEVKMHGIIRKLALWLASDNCENVSSKFLVKSGRGLKDAPIPKDWEGATRISLMFNDIEKLDISPECTTLSTLLLQNNPNLKEIHPDFFKNMPGLKVLDLSHTAIKQLSIGADTLRRLQHLNLCNTRIRELPKELSNLKELRHLDLSETSALEVIPDGTISVLHNLRVLNVYRSLYEIRGREDLNLERLVNLEFLGITVHSEEVLEKLRAADRLARSTHCLSLQNCQGMKTVQVSVFQHMSSLEVLFVHDCSELKHLILDDLQDGFNLQELTLAFLPNFEEIIRGPQCRHHLDNLGDLTIESCDKLENVTWILQLKSLERLAISQCDAMEQVVQEDIIGGDASQDNEIQEEEQSPFRRLKSIILKDLQKLESICRPRLFPCLETISVKNCLKLKTLPLGCNYQNLKLKQISGSLDWWSKLNWEDVNSPTNFGHFFMPI